MQVIVNDENKELIYELVYDEETLKVLIDEIIKKCSIRIHTKSYINASSKEKVESRISSTTDWAGNKIHENVTEIKKEEVNDPFDFWRPGDPVPFSFMSNKLFIPEIVDFLIKILTGEDVDYEWFINRRELRKKEELQLEIQKIDAEINEISNFDTEIKIAKLKELANKVAILNNIPEFDYDLLSKYYDILENCIKLELVQETIRYQRKLVPPKYTEIKLH